MQLEQHLALGGSDRPGEVFLSFLVRYGKVTKGLGLIGSQNGMDTKAQTHLSQQTILNSNGQYSADMSAVFLLDHCVDLFQRIWGRLSSTFNVIRHNTKKSEQKKNKSVLVDLFDVDQLIEDREECLERAARLSQYCKKAKERERQEAATMKQPPQVQITQKEQRQQSPLKRKNSDDFSKKTGDSKKKSGSTKKQRKSK